MGFRAVAVFVFVGGLIAGVSAQADVSKPLLILSNAAAQVGSDPAPLPLQGIRGPRIAPDGTRIVFTAAGDLWVVDLDEKLLAQDKAPKGRHLLKDAALDFDPAWSPDGTQLAFVSDRSGKPEIWLRDMKTNKERQLTTLDDAVETPSWSPDSNRIAFFKVPPVGDPDLRSLNVVTVFTGDMKQIRSQVRTAGPISWSPDGETLMLKVQSPALSPAQGSRAKFLLISLTNAPDRATAPETGLSPHLNRGDGPMWSPDGSKLAYVNDGVLWVAPVTARGPRAGEIAGVPRAMTTERADSPSWTGDSNSIVYVATDRMKRTTLNGVTKDVQPILTWHRDIPQGRTVVWAGRLWDGVGTGYRENVDVVIDGDVITAVEPHAQRDARTRIVNASHMMVMPGMIDARARLTSSFGERLGRLLLSYGITTVREWGDDPYDALERRESWTSGKRPGPRDLFVNTQVADDVRGSGQSDLEIERAKHLGYDLAIADQRVIDRVPGAVASGTVSFGLPDAAKPMAASAKPMTTVMPDLALDGGFLAMALRDPTVLGGAQFVALHSDYEAAAFKEFVEGARPGLSSLERKLDIAQNTVRQFIAQGGRIGLGSGAPGVPYGLGFLVECELSKGAGLSTLQVLQTATSGAALALGLDKQLGTVEAGKLADLAIVDGDPLSRTADLANIAGVVTDGRYYIIDELLRH